MNNLVTNLHEKIGYGLKDGSFVHINDALQGLDCECVCPACGGWLVAKKGEKNIHHFAHYEAGNCDGTNESILHQLGKKIIAEALMVRTPDWNLEVIGQDLLGMEHSIEHADSPFTLLFSKVELEKGFNDFVPDITAFTQDEQVFIEIVVTNPVSDVKLEKVIQQKISMLSIDLSSVDPLSSIEDLKEAVLRSAPREWTYHTDKEGLISDMEAEMEHQIEGVNRHIRSCVNDHFKIDETPSSVGLPSVSNGEAVLIGYKSGYGYSQKSKSEFDVSELVVLKPLNQRSSANYTVRGIGGFEIDRLPCSSDVILRLEGLDVPSVITPRLESSYIAGKFRNVVTEI